MVCTSCGEKPKNTAKDFTKAVVEINNPETLILLRKVVLPASMGTEEDSPASVGRYYNVLLQYEANGHLYLYSSDGIPTALETSIPQEILDAITTLQNEVVNLENDFVGTDGVTDGVHGLVPAPEIADAGKFLRADGTWTMPGGGGGPVVVQTTGNSTIDVMSQKAVTDALPASFSNNEWNAFWA